MSIKIGINGQDGSETQFNSSLIASWGSKTEQTQAQSGSEPNQNCLIFASVELGIKRGGECRYYGISSIES